MSARHDFLWCTLVHLGTNFWHEEGNNRGGGGGNPGKKTYELPASAELRFDWATWDRYLHKMQESGVNCIILDVGDGVVYRSHPEIAAKGALTREELESEVARMWAMGFEVIPKLNFSTAHDVWMKDYARMVSTPIYYQVCKDMIEEVCDIFKPRYLHLGMDEEVYNNQMYYDYVVIRQNNLFWHDFYYLVDCVEKQGVRAMMWSDYARYKGEEFVRRCPKSVVQCVWYYFEKFGDNLEEVYEVRVRPYEFLDSHGYDILPTGSVEYFDENMELLTKFCHERVSKEHLLGFAQTTWVAVTPEWTQVHDKGNRTLNASREWYEKQNH